MEKLIKITNCTKCNEDELIPYTSNMLECVTCKHIFKSTKLIEDTMLEDLIISYLKDNKIPDNFDKRIEKCARYFYNLGKDHHLIPVKQFNNTL